MSPTRRLALFAVLALTPCISPQAGTVESPIYTLEVADVSARVGEPAVMVARLKLHDGYRLLHAYNNRIGQLSALDAAVDFDSRAFPGTDQDGTLVFAVALHATKPGRHPINGVIRFGYMQGTEEMAMISVPVMATVNTP